MIHLFMALIIVFGTPLFCCYLLGRAVGYGMRVGGAAWRGETLERPRKRISKQEYDFERARAEGRERARMMGEFPYED